MRRRSLLSGLLLHGVAAPWLAACRDSGDASRPQGTIDAPSSKPEPAPSTSPARARIVSLSPSTTEAAFAIGVEDRLVGRSSHCDYPAQALALPSVGGYADPNVEAILALQPTMVIGSRGPAGPELVGTLEGHGVAVWFPATDGVEDIAAMLREMGTRFGAEARAEKVARELEGRIERISRWASHRRTVRAVMVFDASPMFVAGPGGFPDDLLRRAGGKNLVERGGAYPTIDVEHLLSLDPDVIIDAMAVGPGAPDKSVLPSSPGWSEIGAVKRGRVRRLTSDAALRPGPRIADGLRDVARALHDAEPPS